MEGGGGGGGGVGGQQVFVGTLTNMYIARVIKMDLHIEHAIVHVRMYTMSYIIMV